MPFGNFILKAAVRQLNHEHPGMDAIWVQPLAAAARALGKVFESGADDVHAGEVETSLVMALCPGGGGRWRGRPRAGGRSRHDRAGALRDARARRGCGAGPASPREQKGEAALAAASDATAAYIRDKFEILARMKKSGR